MYSLSVKNNRGDLLELGDNELYTVYKITGLNPPKANISSSVNATTDGSSVNSVRVDSRNIVIYLTVNGQVETNRINLYKYFPIKKPVTLFFKNGSREVLIEGVVELIECDLFTNKQVAQISIICPQPYFKAVDTMISYFSDIVSQFTFPFSIHEAGMELSIISNSVRKSVINAGDVDTGCIIELLATGNVVNPVIYDIDRGTHFKLNMTLQSGDTVIINTVVGEKSVTLIRNGVVSNVLGYISQDSTWFTLEAGDNVFTYGATSGQTYLQITFSTNVLYSGV